MPFLPPNQQRQSTESQLGLHNIAATTNMHVSTDDMQKFRKSTKLNQMQQESCAIAKMTVRCALYMSALKVFECANKI